MKTKHFYNEYNEYKSRYLDNRRSHLEYNKDPTLSSVDAKSS